MLSWAQILYGLAVTAVAETLLTVVVPRWRRLPLIATVVVVAVLAVLGWQTVLRVTHAREFFTDLPFRPFPISWQASGSGLSALALVSLAPAYGPLRRQPAPAAATLATAAGAVALLVDVYLY
jgi:hypothetical protein